MIPTSMSDYPSPDHQIIRTDVRGASSKVGEEPMEAQTRRLQRSGERDREQRQPDKRFRDNAPPGVSTAAARRRSRIAEQTLRRYGESSAAHWPARQAL